MLKGSPTLERCTFPDISATLSSIEESWTVFLIHENAEPIFDGISGIACPLFPLPIIQLPARPPLIIITIGDREKCNFEQIFSDSILFAFVACWVLAYRRWACRVGLSPIDGLFRAWKLPCCNPSKETWQSMPQHNE